MVLARAQLAGRSWGSLCPRPCRCQLPATVLSHEAQAQGLDVSLFDRLISMGMEVSMRGLRAGNG